MKTFILLLLLTTGNVAISPAQSITKNFNSIIAPIIDNYPKTFEVQRRRSVRRTRRTTRRAPNQQRQNQQSNQRNRSGLFGGLFGGMLLGSMFGNMFGGGGGGGSLLMIILLGFGIMAFLRARSHRNNSDRYTDIQSDNYSNNYLDNDTDDNEDEVAEETIEEIYEDDVLVETRRTFSNSSDVEITDHRKDKK